MFGSPGLNCLILAVRQSTAQCALATYDFSPAATSFATSDTVKRDRLAQQRH
jgi:hypothetical protein